MKVLISKQTTTTKPENYAPYQYVDAYTSMDISIKEFGKLIGDGHAWRAFNYVEGAERVLKKNVTCSYVLGLDFDNVDAEPSEICEYAASIGLPLNLYYYTFSQGKKPKNNFRAIWCFKESIGLKHYETMYKMLLELFAQYNPDRNVKDASRLWNGTCNEVVIENEKFTTLKELGWIGVCEKIEKNIQTSSIKRTTKTFCDKYFDDDDDCAPAEAVTIDVDWFEQLRGVCGLWDKWESGKYLKYNQRLTLFTNLKYLKYSDNNRTVLQDVLNIFYNNAATYENHTCNEEQIRKAFGSRSLTPRRIMKDEFGRYITIPEFFSGGRKEQVINNVSEKVDLEGLDKELDAEIPKALSSTDNVYIECQTASGKTQRVIDWMLHTLWQKKRIIYSVPRYNTIDEFVDRFKMAYNERCAFGEDIEYPIHTVPQREYTNSDLIKLELGLAPDTKNLERSSAIRELMGDEWTGIYVVTHSLLSKLNNIDVDTIIIDENIEETLVRNIKYDLDLLKILENYTPDTQPITDLINNAKEKKIGEYIDISGLVKTICSEKFNLESYINAKQTPKVKNLYACCGLDGMARVGVSVNEHYIRFTLKSNLLSMAQEQQIPIKFFSATPKDAYLKAYYQEFDVEKLTFTRARNKGEIIQYVGCTGAKGNKDGKKIKNLINYIKKVLTPEQIANSYCLTFKDFADEFESAGFKIPRMPISGEVIHLANNSGLDFLKGYNVIVAGKFDYRDEWYFDTFYDLHEPTVELPHREKTKKIINGNAQQLFLWQDQQLQDIQLGNIREHLEQSTGRARALRESGANVYVFADLKIADADKYIK